MRAFSGLIPCCTKGNSWPAVRTGGFRRNPAICFLHPELLAAACEAGLEQSQVARCWHCLLVATIKPHLIYTLCHMHTASSLGPRQESGRESQVMSLGLAHPWQTFKLSACLGVDDIHSQLSFVSGRPPEGSWWSLLLYVGPVWSCWVWGLSTFHPYREYHVVTGNVYAFCGASDWMKTFSS